LAGDARRREQTVLASKVYYPPNKYTSRDPIERSGAHAGPNGYGLSARHIRMACDASLRRLRTDYIDIYQMHHVDRLTPIEETWDAMQTLVAQGKVISVGSSNFAGWHLARACETAKNRHFTAPVSEQSLYNLCSRTVELELLPACQAYGVGFLAFSPLANGLLGGISESGARRKFAQYNLADETRTRIERFEKLAADLGHTPGSVAIAWLLSRPSVTAVILGPRTIEQLEDALQAVPITLADDTLSRLDELFPGPGGAAPEAYAW